MTDREKKELADVMLTVLDTWKQGLYNELAAMVCETLDQWNHALSKIMDAQNARAIQELKSHMDRSQRAYEVITREADLQQKEGVRVADLMEQNL